MCGRLCTAFLSPEQLKHHFSLDLFAPFTPRYNIAPSLPIPVIRQTESQRSLSLLTWGLIPHWAKERKSGLYTFNARAETVSEKPTFRAAFKSRRCLIPASAFYEWQALPEHKQAYAIRRRDGAPLALAGVWESWFDPATGAQVESCAIITVAANAQMQTIHQRMPAILEVEQYRPWLDPQLRDVTVLQGMLEARAVELDLLAVSGYVNDARHEGEGCLQPAGAGSMGGWG
jgi:putative SOS response-associated peptidase YedK